MRKTQIFTKTIVILGLFLMTGCTDDFEEINTNPSDVKFESSIGEDGNSNVFVNGISTKSILLIALAWTSNWSYTSPISVPPDCSPILFRLSHIGPDICGARYDVE